MVEPVFVCFPRWMVCCQPGASGSYCFAQRLLGRGGGGGGTRILTSFLRGCVSVLYQDFAPKLDLNLIYCLLDLVNCFELLWGIGGYDVLSMWAHPGFFYRSLLPPALFNTGTLDVTGFHFDVSGAALLRGGYSVSVVSRLMMGDGDWFPVATTARSRIGGSGCCDWLYFVT